MQFSAFVQAGLAKSNSEVRKLIRGGGVRIDDAPVRDEKALLTLDQFEGGEPLKLSVGKKKHALLVLRDS